MSIQSSVRTGEQQQIAIGGGDTVAAIRSSSPRVASRQRTHILIGPGGRLKPWGRLGGLARELEAIAMESRGSRGFGKYTSITDMDGGGVDHVTRVPSAGNVHLESSSLGGNPSVDDLGAAVGTTVRSYRSVNGRRTQPARGQ
jgi:hypothetical protein